MKIQRNLDLMFLESTFSLILHTFLSVLPKDLKGEQYIFLEFTFVLATQLIDCTFELSISWAVDVI
jgi:hypothetical protein